MIARLSPPDRIGISIASVSSPSSGNWNATDVNVGTVRNRSVARLNTSTTTASSISSPAISLPVPSVTIRLSQGVGEEDFVVANRVMTPPPFSYRAPWPRPARSLMPLPDSVIATRITAPTIILKA